MQRKASAVWQGGIKDGKGSITTDSGVLTATPYSFSTRFGRPRHQSRRADRRRACRRLLDGALNDAG